MTQTMRRWRSAAAGGEGSDDGDGGAAADRAGRRATTGRPLRSSTRDENNIEDDGIKSGRWTAGRATGAVLSA
jgi:hypothetical protein